MEIVCLALGVYWFVLLARIISSWFPRPYSGPWAAILSLIWALTDPILRPLRNLLPPARMGMMAIDFSPIVVFVLIGVLQRVFCR